MRTTTSTARVLIALTWLGSACHGGHGSVDVTGPDNTTKHPDAAAADAGTSSDAAEPADAATSSEAGPKTDAGRDASTDAADDDDAQVSPLDPLRDCHVGDENNTLALTAPVADEGGYSLAIGLTGFGVAYRSQTGCGKIGALPVAALGAFAEPRFLLGDECDNLQDLTLLQTGNGWQLAWVDNAAGSAELRTLGLSDGMTPATGSVITQVTHNALREYRPVLGQIAGATYAVWIAADTTTGQRRIEAKNLADQSDVITLLGPESGHKPVALAFSPMGVNGASLAFIDEQQTPGVWLLRLDKSGAVVGSATLVSDAVSAGSSVDIAARDEEGGAVAYSVDIGNSAQEVRFHRLDQLGNLVGVETKLVGGALQARDASITRLGGGYVVAYRQIPTGTLSKSEVRLAFISKEGDIMRDGVGRMLSYAVADAGLTGGRVTVRLSTDGELLVGFVDNDDTGVKLKLVRKRLDCAL